MEQEIPNRRRSRSEVTPQIEDGGLFKHELQDVSVDLNPVFGRNSRGDLLIKGIARPEKEVEVVFAGRRLPDAADLYERVKQLGLSRGPRARFQVSIRGNWRLRFAPDESGWGVKSYQLLAAQWAYFDDEGEPVLCGCLPVPIQNHIMDRARAAQEDAELFMPDVQVALIPVMHRGHSAALLAKGAAGYQAAALRRSTISINNSK